MRLSAYALRLCLSSAVLDRWKNSYSSVICVEKPFVISLVRATSVSSCEEDAVRSLCSDITIFLPTSCILVSNSAILTGLAPTLSRSSIARCKNLESSSKSIWLSSRFCNVCYFFNISVNVLTLSASPSHCIP